MTQCASCYTVRRNSQDPDNFAGEGHHARKHKRMPEVADTVKSSSKRTKFFYGWWIVFTAALGLCLGGPPIAVFSFGVFFKSLVHEFHASRAAISFAFTLYNFFGAMCVPLVGRLIDRFGTRKVILPGTVLFALILISGRALGTGLWQFYLFYAALGLIGSSTSPVPYGVVVSHWFNRRRGLALGFTMVGIGLGAILVPLLAQRFIAAFDWRMAYALFGSIMLLIPFPVVAALLRNEPAERGLLPDGVAPTKQYWHANRRLRA